MEGYWYSCTCTYELITTCTCRADTSDKIIAYIILFLWHYCIHKICDIPKLTVSLFHRTLFCVIEVCSQNPFLMKDWMYYRNRTLLQCGTVWYSVVQCGTVWYSVVQCGTAHVKRCVMYNWTVHTMKALWAFKQQWYCHVTLGWGGGGGGGISLQ